jgi:PAS domain S-box-containing protein
VGTEPIRVLLVDDDQGDFEMIRVMLAKAQLQDYELHWVSSYEEALDAFNASEFDVYFLDYFLEDRTGLDILKEARDRGITAPIILLTGRGSRAVDMEAMELGASNYLVKSLIDPDVLERAIRHALEREKGRKAISTIQGPGSSPDGVGPAWTADLRAGEGIALFRAIFDGTRTGVAVVGLGGTVDEANHAFSELFSSQAAGLIGVPFLDLLAESDREAVRKEFEALARAERTKFEAARRYLTLGGDPFWAHTTTTLIRELEGGPCRMVVMVEKEDTPGG